MVVLFSRQKIIIKIRHNNCIFQGDLSFHGILFVSRHPFYYHQIIWYRKLLCQLPPVIVWPFRRSLYLQATICGTQQYNSFIRTERISFQSSLSLFFFWGGNRVWLSVGAFYDLLLAKLHFCSLARGVVTAADSLSGLSHSGRRLHGCRGS